MKNYQCFNAACFDSGIEFSAGVIRKYMIDHACTRAEALDGLRAERSAKREEKLQAAAQKAYDALNPHKK